VAQGHHVSVATVFPHYPEWKLPAEYRRALWRREVRNGVHLYRGFVYVPSKQTTLRRILYDTSIGLSTTLRSLPVCAVDLVLAVSPPLQAGLAGCVLSWLKAAPLVLQVQDLVPDLAIALGMLRNPWAIRLARKGFTIDEHYQRLAKFRLQALRASRSSAKVFLENKEVPSPGFIIKQPDLAKTLETIAKQGKDGFYSGPIAKKLVDGVRKSGGIWSMKDLIEYSVIERPPLQGQYQDIHITATAPPSSGGVALLTMLNILANYHLNDLDSSTQKHLIIETMRRAYRDRAEFLGDPDYVDIPVQRLIHPFYAAGLNVSIRLDQATPSSSLPGTPGGDDGAHTTHFSVLDREGNRVAATLTINLPFGSGFMPPGTGILLNDEMDDFSIKSGVPNVYGLIGAHANAIAPGKRPLSSMTPTFLDDGEKIALFGTPGGSRIITMLLLAVLDFAQGGDPASWVSVKRYHHQFMPDAVSYEPNAFSEDEVSRLVALGHILKQRDAPYGNMQAVLWDRKLNKVLAASDPRGNGLAQVR